MTNYEMVQVLSEKMGVSMEAAKEALEACDWDMLDASILLEQANGGSKSEYSTKNAVKTHEKCEKPLAEFIRKFFRFLRKIIRIGNRNKLEIRRKDDIFIELPVTLVVILLLLGHGFTVAALIIALFTGFKFRFSGEELGTDSVNEVMDKISNIGDKLKDKNTDSE